MYSSGALCKFLQRIEAAQDFYFCEICMSTTRCIFISLAGIKIFAKFKLYRVQLATFNVHDQPN